MTKLDELVAKYGMEKLNTMTRYPSILTYHELNKGGVRDALTKPEEFPKSGAIIATEKVDGTNYRIVSTGDDFFIGSRERFAFAYGDRICTDNTARAVMPDASMLSGELDAWGHLTVVFGEVYGWKIQKPRYNWQDDKSRDFALFDVWQMPLDEAEEILAMPIDKISAWREAGKQPWFAFNQLDDAIDEMFADPVPIRKICSVDMLPKGAEEARNWLDQFKYSRAVFDESEEPNGMYGKAEGVVIRTPDRKWIRKLRFEDYAKGARKGFK